MDLVPSYACRIAQHILVDLLYVKVRLLGH